MAGNRIDLEEVHTLTNIGVADEGHKGQGQTEKPDFSRVPDRTNPRYSHRRGDRALGDQRRLSLYLLMIETVR